MVLVNFIFYLLKGGYRVSGLGFSVESGHTPTLNPGPSAAGLRKVVLNGRWSQAMRKFVEVIWVP